ncbi:MAG: hypothetical protein JSV08_01285 [Acidobacteriota bacterium]|nr:MAG: hypothetical protein JSV08_01285 [Acidobacteriota bacterium]
MKKNTRRLAGAILLCVGCSRIPAPDLGEFEKAVVRQCGVAPQTVELGEIEIDRERKEAVVPFTVPELQEEIRFKARFVYHDFRGWELDACYDRFGGWLLPEVFAEEMESFRLSDTRTLLFVAGLAVSAHAMEQGDLKARLSGAELAAALEPHYQRYLPEYEKEFFFRPPRSAPQRDFWGHRLTYALDILNPSMLPFNFEVRSVGADGNAGGRDDLSFSQAQDGVVGPLRNIWYHR